MSPTGPNLTQTGVGTGSAYNGATTGTAAPTGVTGQGASWGWSAGGQLGQGLQVTNPGFNIPSTAIIDGILVEYDRSDVSAASGLIEIALVKAGTIVAGSAKGGAGGGVDIFPATAAWLGFGSSTDLWSTAWTPADINNSGFGVVFYPYNTHGGFGTAVISGVRITVYWHTAPADVPKRYLHKVFNSAGIYLGLIPKVSSEFTFSQDINTAGTTLNIQVGLSADSSSNAADIYTDESGAPYTDEAGVNNYTAEGNTTFVNGVPLIAPGNAFYDALIKNGNKIIVYEVSYYYPNGKAVFSGHIEHWEAGFGGDGGSDYINMIVYSDGGDLDNFIARGAPFTYTTDQSQTAQNTSGTLAAGRQGNQSYGQSFKVGVGVTNIGAITVMLQGSGSVSVSVYSDINFSQLLGKTTQNVSASNPTATEFAFANLISVTAGVTYYFVVSAADSISSLTIYYSNANPYANGNIFVPQYVGAGSYALVADLTSDLYFITASGVGTTTGTYTSQDPTTGMLEAILSDYQSRGGSIQYSSSTIDATGLTETYGLNTNTILEAIQAILNMSPNGFYWYVDLGTDMLYFKNTSVTADFTITKGLQMADLNVVASVENVKNQVYFSGGAVSGSNIYTSSNDQTSVAAYGTKLDRQSDNRVTDLSTAQTIARGMVAKQKFEQYQTVLKIIDKTMDTTLLKPGKTIGFNGFGSFVDSLVLQIVRLEYHPEYVILTLGILPKRLSPKFEQIVRGLVAQQTIANPSTPS